MGPTYYAKKLLLNINLSSKLNGMNNTEITGIFSCLLYLSYGKVVNDNE